MSESEISDSEIPNDQIDIYADPTIRVKKLEPLNEREFRIQLSGLNVDTSIVNALRRTVMTSIPVYAFNRANTFIEVKRSRHMYNNDLIYNQIETLPIFDIPNYFDLENPEIFLPNEVMKNLFSNFVPEKYTTNEDGVDTGVDQNKKLFAIELTINVKNKTDDDVFVSTHDAILKVDGKVSNSYKTRRPISILVLKPGEEISLRAEANLGISKMYASYEATTNAVHEEITPTKFNLWYETLGQLDQSLIFTKACTIIIKKLQYLKEFVERKFSSNNSMSDSDNVIELQLYGEDHTIGNLLATILQKCEFVSKAGYNKPHQLIDQIVVSYKIFDDAKEDPIQVFSACVNYLVKVFELISAAAAKAMGSK